MSENELQYPDWEILKTKLQCPDCGVRMPPPRTHDNDCLVAELLTRLEERDVEIAELLTRLGKQDAEIERLHDEETEVTLADGRASKINPSWMAEAADDAIWRWSRFAAARDPLSQAGALVNLSNAMSDMATFLPGYNSQTGEIDRPGDEQ